MNEIPVYTYLHGANVLQRYRARCINEDLCQYQIAIPVDKTIISFGHRGLDKWIERSHLFLFEGFTITGGMSDKVTSISITMQSGDLMIPVEAKRTITARSSEVHQPKLGDLTFYNNEDRLFRHEEGNRVIQEIPLHLIIVPKSDVRFIFMTYKEGSLEPVYKTVRVLNKELCIETATK